jgi:hypothetical protein
MPTNDFTAVWGVALAGILEGEYTYNVAQLDGAGRGGEGLALPVYAIDQPWQISLGGFPRVRSRRH